MASISRRKLIATATLAPLALNVAARAQAAAPAARRAIAPKPDFIVAKVAAWMAEYDARETMIRAWQDWENALCEKIRPLGMNLTQAGRSGLPEARAMRALDGKIKIAGKRLDRAAGRIALMRPTSAHGALAKIELGLKIQGPYDWEDFAYALISDGCEELRAVATAQCASVGQSQAAD